MNKCLVIRLNEAVENTNLKTLFTDYRSKADFSVVPQYVQLVGTGLPVTQFKTGECRIEADFIGINNNTTGFLFTGFLHEDNSDKIRLQFKKPYTSGSAGASTYTVQSAYGSGSPDTGNFSLNKDSEYKLVSQLGVCKIYNSSGSLVGTINYTESGNVQIDKFYYAVADSSSCKKDMFYMKCIKIIRNQDEKILLSVYPAVDENNQGCLYDSENECFYYANTGQLAVSNDE